ncbi:MAG: twin-arginine translocase TatA/TatE family subunit [Coriobacteriales bacterium]|nr:twin-arginine translocase TatA/TatE family subunit [Coriobacteriales bacterium]
MFGIGGFELAIIVLFAFLIFGPDKLPKMARSVGQVIRQLRGLKDQADQVIKAEVYEPLQTIQQSVAPLTKDPLNLSGILGDKPASPATEDSASTSAGATPAPDNTPSSDGTPEPVHQPPVPSTDVPVVHDGPVVESFAQRKERLERRYQQTKSKLADAGTKASVTPSPAAASPVAPSPIAAPSAAVPTSPTPTSSPAAVSSVPPSPAAASAPSPSTPSSTTVTSEPSSTPTRSSASTVPAFPSTSATLKDSDTPS